MLDKTDKQALKPSKTTETEGQEKAAEQGEVESFHSETDPDTALLLPQEKTALIAAKLLDYVEIHKINKDGALALLPKQKEDSSHTEKPGTPESSKEYTRVSRLVDNSILVLARGPHAQTPALGEEPVMEAPPSVQQDQDEKGLVPFTPTPSTCRRQLGGLDYLDPACFKQSFQ